VCWKAGASTWRTWGSGGALALWLVSVLGACSLWAASGVPRESGSWRGSWALTDGAGLYGALTSRGIDHVVVAYWTRWPLQFAERSQRRRDPHAPALSVHMSPRSLSEGEKAAFALRDDTPLLRVVQSQLVRQRTPFVRSQWSDFSILWGIEADRIRSDPNLPAVLDRGVWNPPPSPPDGFN